MTSLDVGLAERFDFGRVVSRTFALIGRNLFPFLAFALLLVGAPQLGVLYAQSTVFGAGETALMAAVGIGGVLLNLIMSYILQGAVTRWAVDDLSGAGGALGAAVVDGLRNFFMLFVAGLLVGLGVSLAALLLLVPGVIIAVRWAVAGPVLVVERLGPTSAIGRSAELTRGHRWSVFGLCLLYLVFAYALQIVVVAVASALGESTNLLYLADGEGYLYAAVTAAMASLITLVRTVGAAVLYFELRRVKEGVDVTELAKVFE